MIRFLSAGLILAGVLLLTRSALAADAKGAQASSAFDSSRHMRVSEIKPGMTGYGLSVFKGTKIERFDVEVVSVLKNFNPKHDVILIRCKGQNLEHTGAIAGMSGSPIFLKDEQGRERMIGAFAYGFPMAKDPIAGVQPIEYMLRLPAEKSGEAVTGASDNKARADSSAVGARPRIRWSLRDLVPLNVGPAKRPSDEQSVFAVLARDPAPAAAPQLGGNETTRLQPLVTPLMTSGLSSKLVQQCSSMFRACGFELLQSGVGVSGSAPAEGAPAEIEPGSVLACPLLTGDVELVATGTCTEVLGNRVFAFGHSFNSEGPISLPMGSGQINGIIATLTSSFKLGSMTALRGTLVNDQTVGVSGLLGDSPSLVPVELRVKYEDKSQEDLVYHFNAVRHPRLTAPVIGMAIMSAVTGDHDLPQYHTLDYDLNVQFANGRSVRVQNSAVNVQPPELFMEIGTPLMAASDNPFERVMVEKVTGTIRVTPEARSAQILSINLPKLKYRPGETAKAYVTYRPFRGAESVQPVDVPLPKDLSDGDYQLVISDWQRYVQDEQGAEPFRFTAESIDDVFSVLKDMTSIKHNALYARLVRQADGVAIGRTAMPRLPSSARNVLLGGGRSNTTPFVSSTIKVVPTEMVMEGSAEFQLTIDSEVRVEGGTKNAPKTEPSAPAGPQQGPVKSEKPKEPAKAADAPSAPVPNTP
jgi:hypothetical protein